MKRVLLLTGMCMFLLVPLSFTADIPKMIDYRGSLTDSAGTPLTGAYSMTFRIYDDSIAGNLKWVESQNGPDQNGVRVLNGLFNVTLGEVLAVDLPFDEAYWLEVIVDDIIMPRVKFFSAGYAYRSAVASRALVADSAGAIMASGSLTFDSLHVLGNTALDGNLHIGGAIHHDSPIPVYDGLEFLNFDGAVVYHIEIDEEGEHPGTGMPDAMHGALGFESFAELNPYDMHAVFWDGVEERPLFIISNGEHMQASTFDHSLQVGKARGAGAVDSNYTRLEGYNYIDGDTHGDGADLGVEHEIEAKGNIYSQEDLVAGGGDVTIGDGATAYAGRIALHDAMYGYTTTIVSNADLAADFTLTLPAADGTPGQGFTCDSSGNLLWATPAGAGDIDAVGSMTTEDVFTDTSADDDWLGLGAAAGRIAFDDQATDVVSILDANVGIGESAPAARLHLGPTTMAAAQIRLDSTDQDPSSPQPGDIWFNGTSLNFRRDDSTTVDLLADSVGLGNWTQIGNDLYYDTGNVGIGTTTPDVPLSVTSSIPTQAIFGQDITSGWSQIIIGEEVAADKGFGVGYSHDSNLGFMQVAGDAIGAGITVADGGNVGIGTYSPAVIDLAIGDNDTGLQLQGAGELAFYTNSVERMRIKPNGRVGIRTSDSVLDLAIGDSDTGLHQQGDGVLAFYTNSVERMRIRSDGRVGIGTSSPASGIMLEVDGDVRVNSRIEIGNNDFVINGGNSSFPSIDFESGGWFGYDRSGNTFVWVSDNIERMKLESDHFEVGLNTTASGSKSTAMGWNTTASGDGASTAMGQNTTASGIASTAMGYLTNASGSVSTAMGQNTIASGQISTAMGWQTKAESQLSTAIGQYNVGGGNPVVWVSTDPLFEIGFGTSDGARSNAFMVRKDANIYFNGGTLIHPSSDRRLKKNITEVDNALDKVMRLRGVTFEWKDKADTGVFYGMIAQEVEEVLPEIVHTNKKGIKTIAWWQLNGLYVEAIQEQQEQIEELNALNTALTEENEGLTKESESRNKSISTLQEQLTELELKVNDKLVKR